MQSLTSVSTQTDFNLNIESINILNVTETTTIDSQCELKQLYEQLLNENEILKNELIIEKEKQILIKIEKNEEINELKNIILTQKKQIKELLNS